MKKVFIVLTFIIGILVYTNLSKEDVYENVNWKYNPTAYKLDITTQLNLFIFTIYSIKVGVKYEGTETQAVKYDHTITYLTSFGNQIQLSKKFIPAHNYRYNLY